MIRVIWNECQLRSFWMRLLYLLGTILFVVSAGGCWINLGRSMPNFFNETKPALNPGCCIRFRGLDNYFEKCNYHHAGTWYKGCHTHSGLDPTTSPCNKSQAWDKSHWTGHFASYQLWSLRLHVVPQIQTSLNFWDKPLRLVPKNVSCELFIGLVPATSPFVVTLQGTNCRDYM